MTKKRAEVALITGSRRGIGLGIAMSLAREGFRIILNATAPDKVAAEAINAVRSAGMETTYIQADVSLRSDRQRLLKGAKEAYGRLDILVNNAGVGPLVREDILKQLDRPHARVFISGFDRPNLKYFAATLSNDEKNAEMMRILPTIKGSGIVYVSTQRAVETITGLLNEKGLAEVFVKTGTSRNFRDNWAI